MYRRYKQDEDGNGLPVRPFSALSYLSGDPQSGFPSRPSSVMSLSKVELAVHSARDLREPVVEECWKAIEEQCRDYRKQKLGGRVSGDTARAGRGGWKVVRVFVSSTFTDFHNEREVLVKKVFPALRDWCEGRRLSLVECDLRWGVPKDSPSATTISTCMEELSRCLVETDGEPFFVNMLGERYGWRPEPEEVPEDLQAQYKWVHGISITHMEILHGALRSRNANAVFFLRSPRVLDDIPQNKRKRFVDADELSMRHLEVLKKKLKEQFPSQVFQYDCQYAGLDTSTGREQVRIKELENFEATVLDFLQSAIARKYPEEKNPSNYTQDEQEHEVHRAVMETKGAFVCGRDKELRLLMRFARGEVASSLGLLSNGNEELHETVLKKMEEEGSKPTDNMHLCVKAKAGYGKSALLAKFAKNAVQADLNVFYHCVGCTSNSIKESKILARLIKALAYDPTDERLGALDKETITGQLPVLRDILQQCRQFDKQILIVIDGVNEMSDSNAPHHLSWLPVRFPARVRCVLGVNADWPPSLCRLQDIRTHLLDLPIIDMAARCQIVDYFFQSYNKRLHPTQMEGLLQKAGSAVPMWLAVACEELRVFGDFTTLTQKIHGLPETLEALLVDVLARLIREDATGCMEKALKLICCSHAGLPESQIPGLLGSLDPPCETPPIVWATVRRYLKPFIRSVIYWYNGCLKVQFNHQAVTQAVRAALLSSVEEERACHTHLADFYQYHSLDETFTVEDLPHHLNQAGLGKRLKDFYYHDIRSSRAPLHLKQVNLNRLRCQQPAPELQGHSRTVKMCLWCAEKHHLLSPTPMATKTLCVVCGSWVPPHASTEAAARLCMRHSPHTPPNVDKCYLCDKLIQGALGSAHQGVLCFHCARGRHTNRCCKLLT